MFGSHSDLLHPRRHPGFPTVSETSINPDLAYSDHLPILLEIPGEQHLKILSYNILGPSAPSGLHSERNWETGDQTNRRYEKIAKGLGDSIKKQQVDVVLLQEAKPVMMTPELLKKALGDKWEIISDVNTSLIACYNKNRFDLTECTINKPLRVQTLTLKEKINSHLYQVNNVWSAYDPFPHRTEEQYAKILSAAPKQATSILAGDANSRIAPLDDAPRNITTGVIPVRFNDDNGAPPNVQIPDHPDGGFFRDNEGNIRQLQQAVIDLQTGNVEVDARTKDELNPWPEYRMILCLDQSYRTRKVINDQDVFSYEEQLKSAFKNYDIAVRIASDCCNNKAVALRFPPELKDAYEAAKNALPKNQGFQFTFVQSTALNDSGKGYRCIFAPLDKTAELHSAIHQAFLTTELKRYTEKRSAEGGILGFFRNLARLDGTVKTTAANKLISVLKGQMQIDLLTSIDFEALCEGGSDLRKVLTDHQKRGGQLPPLLEKTLKSAQTEYLVKLRHR